MWFLQKKWATFAKTAQFISFLFFRMLFQPPVEPVKEGALPEYAILWPENPVVFVREIEIFGRQPAHDGCVVGRHSLRGHNAVVELAVDD